MNFYDNKKTEIRFVFKQVFVRKGKGFFKNAIFKIYNEQTNADKYL